jgi:hypothetical protein
MRTSPAAGADRHRRAQPLAMVACAGVTAGALLVASAATIGSTLAGGAATSATTSATITTVAEPLDPEVILPSRVDGALQRVLAATAAATDGVDAKQTTPAINALVATRLNIVRAHLAGVRQVDAPPPPEDAEESTAGPDSALAILNVEQVTITQVAGLFDKVTAAGLTTALKTTLNAALDRRATFLTKILALDPEEAGAPYADALADTVPNYADEVANLTEALAVDTLTPASRTALQAALTKSKAANTKIIAAFGESPEDRP